MLEVNLLSGALPSPALPVVRCNKCRESISTLPLTNTVKPTTTRTPALSLSHTCSNDIDKSQTILNMFPMNPHHHSQCALTPHDGILCL